MNREKDIIGICGLGLIGGSLALDYQAQGQQVWGWDRDPATLDYAQANGFVDGVLDEAVLRRCSLLLLALYSQGAADYLRSVAPLLPPDCLVMDLCGTKRQICETGFTLARQYGFTFIGGHPMAGTEFSGIRHARKELFRGAPLVLVLPEGRPELRQRAEEAVAPAGFGSYPPATAAEHDCLIAYTSQLAHVVSNAYIKSPTAQRHQGFSAGSYQDMTRVARLNEQMWSQLFLENSENLLPEIDLLIKHLSEYRQAIAEQDRQRLTQLLQDGRLAKEAIDG